jgi:ketosteroid isomerase-like protein
MTQARSTLLTRALEVFVTGERKEIEELFTEDVSCWSPNLCTKSRAELEELLADRDDALANIDASIDALDIIGNKGIAEWRMAADHVGAFLVGDDYLVEPTGRRVQLAGATFAEFEGDRIRAIRHYFDDAALLEQLLLAPA